MNHIEKFLQGYDNKWVLLAAISDLLNFSINCAFTVIILAYDVMHILMKVIRFTVKIQAVLEASVHVKKECINVDSCW